MVVINEIDIYQKTGPNPEDKELFYPKTTWGQVIDKPSWIGSSKPSYSWSEITGKPDVLLYSAQSLSALFRRPLKLCHPHNQPIHQWRKNVSRWIEVRH